MSDNESDIDEGEPTYEIIFDDDETKKKDKYLRRDGRAAAKFLNDDTYVGEYKNGKRDGEGIYTFANGARYAGQYMEGKKHGTGTFTAPPPDGGTYTGEWKNDKRDGEGTYTYANGDIYKGGWRNGAKHGTGTYFYANIQNAITGEWSNGQLMHGTWQIQDGSKYVGKFHKNQPEGAGLYVFSSGNKQSGRYVDGKWTLDNHVVSSHDSTPPLSVIADPFKVAYRAIDKCAIKADHFEGIYRLKKEIDGIPNLRRVTDFPIYGAGQPTLKGFQTFLEQLPEAGYDKCIWINLRSEPIVYVNDQTFAPRDKKKLNENMSFPGLGINNLSDLESRFMEKIRADVTNHGQLLHYYKDTYAENPKDRKNLELEEKVEDLLNIRSLQQVYDSLREEDHDIQEFRFPLASKKTPTPQEFDNLLNILKTLESSAAVVFNCQMGKGRTTTCTVIAVLYKRLTWDNEENKIEDIEIVESDENDPNYKLGQYSGIMKLIKLLQNGEMIKAEVDDAIDRCKQMQNIREIILATKEAYEREQDETRKTMIKTQTQDFFERYYYLILFNAFLKQAAEEDFNASFVQWIKTHPEYLEILGNRENGYLAEFNWN